MNVLLRKHGISFKCCNPNTLENIMVRCPECTSNTYKIDSREIIIRCDHYIYNMICLSCSCEFGIKLYKGVDYDIE